MPSSRTVVLSPITKMSIGRNLLLGWAVMLVIMSAPSRAYNILVFMPYGSHSHKATLIPVIKGLAERNHSVTFITNQESPELRHHEFNYNIDEVVVPNLNYSVFDPESGERNNFFEFAEKASFRSQMKVFSYLSGLVYKVIENTYADPGVQYVLRNGRFDLLILSQVVSYAGYPLAWHFQCPYILSSPNVLMTDSAYLMGDSEHTEYVPFFMTAMTDRMSAAQRAVNTFLTHSLNFYQDAVIFPRIQPSIDRHFPGAPTLTQIKANLSAAFANTHPAFSYPRAYPPGVIEVGGIHCRGAKPLPFQLDNFVSGSSHGFIVFGVGSIIPMDDMPEKMLNVFIRVFARLRQRVVWQWKGFYKPTNVSENILFVDWLPQQDLLGHEKCQLFMTHGGLLSTQEAIYHGVPVLGLPFINDQLLNMDKAVNDGYALQVRWNELDEDRLYNAIKQLLFNPAYRNNVKRRQAIIRDQLDSPLERAVYWSEYYIRHNGAPHLRLGSRNLNRFQRSLLDVYLIVSVILSLIALVMWAVLRKIWHFISQFEYFASLNKLEL